MLAASRISDLMNSLVAQRSTAGGVALSSEEERVWRPISRLGLRFMLFDVSYYAGRGESWRFVEPSVEGQLNPSSGITFKLDISGRLGSVKGGPLQASPAGCPNDTYPVVLNSSFPSLITFRPADLFNSKGEK